MANLYSAASARNLSQVASSISMPESLRWRFRDARIGVDVMPTGPAVRTYNILFGEGRRVGAALIAVD